MTESVIKAGLIEAAIEVIPFLKDEESNYGLNAKDTPVTVAAKIYDSFRYGLSEEQYAMLIESSKRSPKRAKDVVALQSWTDEVTDVFDEGLNPEELGDFAAQFSNYPHPDKAGADEDYLSLSVALIEMGAVSEYPKAMHALLEKLEPMLLPDTEEAMAKLFPEPKPDRRTRSRRKPADPVDQELEDIIADSQMTSREAGELSQDFALGESVDVSLTTTDADAEAKAEEEAKAKAEEEAKAKAEEEAKAKAKADKAAKAKADKEAKAKKAEEEKAAKIKKAAKDKVARESKERAKKVVAEQANATEEKATGAKQRRLARTGGGGTGVVSIIRRALLINPDISYLELEEVVSVTNIHCKKSTHSPKLSDMRNMLNYLISVGVVDMDKLESFKTMKDVAKYDPDIPAGEAAAMDVVLKRLYKS